jgi:hypothetical protein
MSASLRCRHHGDGQQYPWRCASMSAPSARPPFVSHAHLLLLNLLAGARILGPDRDPGGRVALIHLVARVIAVNLGFDVSPTSGHRRRSSASSLGGRLPNLVQVAGFSCALSRARDRSGRDTKERRRKPLQFARGMSIVRCDAANQRASRSDRSWMAARRRTCETYRS